MNYFTFQDLFATFHYPAGESHVRLVGDLPAAGGPIVIEATVRDFESLCNLLTADRILREQRIQARWFVPYFPFARHDRRNDDRDGFELQLALKMVADLDLTIADPHSDVAGMLRHFSQADIVRQFDQAGLFAGDSLVIIPDAGATKKVHSWAGARELLQCTKRRDPASGRLSGFHVPPRDLQGRPCVIVDDICDGGGTFIGLAQQLAKRNAGPLRLAVTHGLFTKGLLDLRSHFDKLFAMTPTGTAPWPAEHLLALPFQSLYSQGENNVNAA